MAKKQAVPKKEQPATKAKKQEPKTPAVAETPQLEVVSRRDLLFKRFGPPDDESGAPETPAPEVQVQAAPQAVAERFVCNRYPSYKIGLGNRMIEFKNGDCITSDPEEIEAIKADPWFNLFIIPDNLELRQKRR